MDFAKKQLEKYGWKTGDGLGKTSQGITIAIKPQLKSGKEGMGFNISQELTDTWWTKAYSDSLSRINVTQNDSSNELAVSVKQSDEDSVDKAINMNLEDRPMEKMRRRMMKSNFTSFSKGATLSNGEMIDEELSNEKSNNSNSGSSTPKIISDEELFKACGGRTLHKAARFGHKLNGKLARIAAQEDLEEFTSSINKDEFVSLKKVKKQKKNKKKQKHCQEADDTTEVNEEIKIVKSYNSDEIFKKRKNKKEAESDVREENLPRLEDEEFSIEYCQRKKKKKKNSKDKIRSVKESGES